MFKAERLGNTSGRGRWGIRRFGCDESRPGFAGFRRAGALGKLCRRGWYHNEVLAGWTLNLFSAETLVALQVLLAVRAGKFKLAHDGSVAERNQWTTPENRLRLDSFRTCNNS